jgi:hypothetical protein
MTSLQIVKSAGDVSVTSSTSKEQKVTVFTSEKMFYNELLMMRLCLSFWFSNKLVALKHEVMPIQ